MLDVLFPVLETLKPAAGRRGSDRAGPRDRSRSGERDGADAGHQGARIVSGRAQHRACRSRRPLELRLDASRSATSLEERP